jgi:hypothetical protein
MWNCLVGESGNERSEVVRLRRDPSQERSSRDEDSGDYVIGRNWRMVATLNTFDRTNLFPLSAAFARRFASVYVGIPDSKHVLDALDVDTEVARKTFETVMSERLRDGGSINPRPLGPAVVRDAWRYVTDRKSDDTSPGDAPSEFEVVEEALELYVLPQYAGLEPTEWELLRDQLVQSLTTSVEPQTDDSARSEMTSSLDRAMRAFQSA